MISDTTNEASPVTDAARSAGGDSVNAPVGHFVLPETNLNQEYYRSLWLAANECCDTMNNALQKYHEQRQEIYKSAQKI
ncbi:MAG: hypothetical protein WC003_16960 [Terrimicrobiaceae bacterium]